MKRFFRFGVAVAIVMAMTAGVAVADPISGPGKVSVGVDVSIWDSNLPLDVPGGIFPIGGAGQLNGEFTTAKRLGIEIGLRAQERFAGPLTATPNNNGKVGIYEAAVGGPLATWNIDWHVDLRKARGKARGKTLADYTLALETDAFTSWFGFPVPVDLTFGGFIPGNAILYQSSQNPAFGGSDFDPVAAQTYNVRLVLTPKTFKGAQLAVAIQVNAS